MTNNFVIKKNSEDLLVADRIDWISFAAEQNVGMKMNTAPKEGYCMIADMRTPSIESLDLANLRSASIKTTWALKTEPIDRLIENTREYVRFECGEDVYEVMIRVNKTPKPKTSPVTAG